MRMFLVVHLALLLAACGSSGGGGSVPVGSVTIECASLYNEGGTGVCSMGATTMVAAMVADPMTDEAVPCDHDPEVLCMDLGAVTRTQPIFFESVVKNDTAEEFSGSMYIEYRMDCNPGNPSEPFPGVVISVGPIAPGESLYGAGVGYSCSGVAPGDYEAQIILIDSSGNIVERRIGRYTIIE